MTQNIEVVPKDQLASFVDKTRGPSEWLEITQEQVNQFADVTFDQQFIHVDPEAAAKTPFGGTIAHGYLTMSLLSHMQGQMHVMPENTAMGVNYGINKLRFLQPVKVGQRIRGRSVPKSFEEKGSNQVLGTFEITVEIEGESKPALIAEVLYLSVLGG